MANTQWSAVDISNADYVGILEIGDDYFEVVATSKFLVFGSSCNVGMLQSGYIERVEDETLLDTLHELHSDLSVFYRDGRVYTSRIVCNERM
jgi:predicted pyridoxine 5'-phosphate oxidase superfamily flavin-nucleotide-binding protein